MMQYRMGKYDNNNNNNTEFKKLFRTLEKVENYTHAARK